MACCRVNVAFTFIPHLYTELPVNPLFIYKYISYIFRSEETVFKETQYDYNVGAALTILTVIKYISTYIMTLFNHAVSIYHLHRFKTGV
jgi:hypothetical protein